MTTENKSSYFLDRMNLLGVTEESNKILILQNTLEIEVDANGVGTSKQKLIEHPVFSESAKGINILVYTLDRTLINYKPDGSRWSDKYSLTRLKDPVIKKDGSIQKYNIPKGQGTYPFFHPSLIEKFEKQQHIDTLFITEGYFKAWKGCMHGMDVVGVASITTLKEKETGMLHVDIRRLRDICGVKRMVWLTDGDCLDITKKQLEDGIDLYRRPKSFYSSCENFKHLLDDWDGEKWFFHIDTDSIVQKEKITRDECKGLDDLLIRFGDRTGEVVTDSQTVAGASQWFVKLHITIDTRRIYSYFHLSNVTEFYLYHIQRRPELKNIEFNFNGTRYKYDEKENECRIVSPGAAKLYFRVGDNYYKFIEKVNEEGIIERAFEKRQKTTIQDDHGKKFCEHIPKYEAFCNRPSHTDYQQVIHDNFNVYFQFEHEPLAEECTEDDCPVIMSLFKHIFGEKLVNIPRLDGTAVNTAYYNLGLDLVQIMYQRPTQRLPILCLVSRENETGKSTFGNLMKAIFTNNAATVGNADLADDFNSFWATKLLIMCDEAKIDKQAVVEKVKSLTFAKKIGLNAKGKDKIEIPFFGKFMFFTNNEENFIYASEEDLRYWVNKVPRLKEKNPDFENIMLEEIPAFLSFLNHRKIVSPRMTRMWFDPKLLKTEALSKVIANSHSVVKKELTHHLREMFLDFGLDEIYMSCRDIKDTFFRNKEQNYIERVLKEEMQMKTVQWFKYKDGKYNDDATALEAAKKDGLNEMEALAAVSPEGRVLRYSFPKWAMVRPDMSKPEEVIRVDVKYMGRPYKFLRSDFVGADEKVEVPADLLELNVMEPTNGHSKNGHATAQGQLNLPGEISEPIDQLPF